VTAWEEQAACTGTDPGMWFPGSGSTSTALQEARRICARCPVWDACLDHELAITPIDGKEYGIRAGLLPGTRRAIRLGTIDRPTEPPLPEPPPKPKRKRKTAMEEPTPIRPAAPEPAAEPTPAELIAWGAGHDTARIKHLAARAEDALAKLADAMKQETKIAAREAEVARLKALLHNAEQDLRAAKGAPATAKTGSSKANPDTAKIRAWAREHGYEVPVAGVIRADIVQAYHRANPAA
jgi:hypothetical protein